MGQFSRQKPSVTGCVRSLPNLYCSSVCFLKELVFLLALRLMHFFFSVSLMLMQQHTPRATMLLSQYTSRQKAEPNTIQKKEEEEEKRDCKAFSEIGKRYFSYPLSSSLTAFSRSFCQQQEQQGRHTKM